MSEKSAVPGPTVLAPYLDAVSSIFHPIAHPLISTSNRFAAWKESFGLVQPGTVEGLTREIGQVHLANWFVEGARADISKVISANPAFQLQHSFALGPQSGKYNFGAIWTNNSTFLQGGVDGTGSVTMRANQNWDRRNTTKIQGQVGVQAEDYRNALITKLTSEAGRSMLQAEHDILGDHYSINLKTINPGLLDGTGIHIGSVLHSISPRLSAGFETVVHYPMPGQLETATSYMAKLTSLPSAASLASAALTPVGQAPIAMPFNPQWIATAQLQSTGNVQATYYQKLSEKVDVALDFQTVFQPASMMGPAKRDAVATLGAKYDFRLATFRAQMDSTWKVGMLLEQRFTPAFAFLVGGEIDHKKNTSRFGVGIMIESSSMTQEEMIAAGMLQPA